MAIPYHFPKIIHNYSFVRHNGLSFDQKKTSEVIRGFLYMVNLNYSIQILCVWWHIIIITIFKL